MNALVKSELAHVTEEVLERRNECRQREHDIEDELAAVHRRRRFWEQLSDLLMTKELDNVLPFLQIHAKYVYDLRLAKDPTYALLERARDVAATAKRTVKGVSAPPTLRI